MPLMTVAGLPRRIGRTQVVVGLVVLVVMGGIGIAQRAVAADLRAAAFFLVDGAQDPDVPRVGLPDGGRAPTGPLIPVFVGRFAVTDLGCRSWHRRAPVTQVRAFVGAGGRAHCALITRARPETWVTVQLVRLEPGGGAIVAEYPPVMLRWTEFGD
jgi:hypothetical protein